MGDDQHNIVDENLKGDVQRLAYAAAAQAAEDLKTRGFDDAWADGSDIVARVGRTTVRMVNHLRYCPGIRERALDQVAAFIAASLISPSATEPRS